MKIEGLKAGGGLLSAAFALFHSDIDPAAWTLVDGSLYLNYSREIQAKWSADIPGNVGKADANWPGLAGGK